MASSLLILSTPSDISTTNVMRWINYLDNSIPIIRLHSEDLYNASINQTGIEGNLIIQIDNKEILINEIGVAWARKWENPPLLQSQQEEKIKPVISALNANVLEEFNVFSIIL